jgi:hypothetical protein
MHLNNVNLVKRKDRKTSYVKFKKKEAWIREELRGCTAPDLDEEEVQTRREAVNSLPRRIRLSNRGE